MQEAVDHYNKLKAEFEKSEDFISHNRPPLSDFKAVNWDQESKRTPRPDHAEMTSESTNTSPGYSQEPPETPQSPTQCHNAHFY